MSAKGAGPFTLTDITQAAGIGFKHSHGGAGRHYLIEALTGAATFLDYDDDGWQDLFLVQSGPLPRYAGPRPLRSALYRNLGNGTFTEVTEGSGLENERYGIGAAVGDYDADGRPDLYLTAFGGNRLFHNEGSGRFADVTARAGVRGQDLSTSAAWLDYDADGRLDLFVCRYTDYSLAKEPLCRTKAGLGVYCSAAAYPGTHSLLYRNRGDGTFADVTATSGIGRATGRSLGVVPADLNYDGRCDLFVANDMLPNHLFLNRGGGRFDERALVAGISIGHHGHAYAGMGTDVGDCDNSGHPSLVVANYEDEPLSLYRSSGDGTFTSQIFRSGLGRTSTEWVKWGCRFVDLDLDGDQDILVVNGHVYEDVDAQGRKYQHEQPAQAFRNEGDGTFTDVSTECGEFFAGRQVARGAAFGDIDNDGDTDVLVACNNQAPILLRNDTRSQGGWIRLSLAGSGCNREGLGSVVKVTAGLGSQTQWARSGTSYLSDHDRRLPFAIGTDTEAAVEVRWPCGARQRLTAPAGQTTEVREQGCRLGARVR